MLVHLSCCQGYWNACHPFPEILIQNIAQECCEEELCSMFHAIYIALKFVGFATLLFFVFTMLL